MKKKSCAFLLIFLLSLTFGLKAQTCYKLVAYTPQWLDDNLIDYSKLTHINYAFNLVNNDGTLQATPDTAKLNRIVSAAHAANVKVLISIGGWNVGSPDNAPFESISTNSTYLNTFIDACAGLITTYNLDGIDLDWEFPTTGARWNALMVPLSSRVHSMGKLMAAAVTPIASYNDVSMLDILNSMSYDCNCPTTAPYSKAESDMNYWIYERGVARDKIVLGVTFEVAEDRNCTLNTQKADMVKTLGLGGMMIWNLQASPSDLPCIYNALGNVCGHTLFTLSGTATNGTVTKNPNQASYTSGTAVTLTATPNTGYVFANWSGDLTGTTNPASITMNANKSVSAIFTTSSGTTTNLISNGNFSNNLTSWVFNNSGATASASVSNGEAVISITTAGANAWEPQLVHDGFTLVNGQLYTVSFNAKAASGRNVLLVINSGPTAHTSFLTQSVALTTSMQTFTYTFTANANDDNARLDFNCGGNNAMVTIDNVTLTSGIAVTGITVSPTTASVSVGATTTLTAAVLPSNATNKTVSWTSSNTSVATVNSSGVVTGVASGSATISVTTQDGGKTSTCLVTVNSGEGTNIISNGDFSNNLTGWVFNTTGATANASVSNGEAVINITTAGANAWEPQLVHDGFALVNGQLYTISFTAKAASGRNILLFINSGPDAYTSYLTQSVALTTSMQTFTYTFTANANDDNARLDFNCGGNNVQVTIDNVTLTSGIAVTGITVSPTTASVNVGATNTLTATVLPSNATNKTVSWTSSNTSVATVNSSGVVTGVAAGSATITVTTQNGGKTATCLVTVNSGGGTNILLNPGWESGTANWNILLPFSVSTLDKRTGTNSLKLAGTSSWADVYQTVTVTPNTWYFFKVFIKGTSQVQMIVFTNGWVSVASSIVSPTSGWVQYSLRFNSGSNSQLLLDFQDAGAGTSFIDDAEVVVDLNKSARINISDSPTKLENITMYPNPAKNLVNIELTEEVLNAELTILDISGKVIKKQNLLNHINEIDVNGFNEGLYFIQIRSNDLNIVKKLIIE